MRARAREPFTILAGPCSRKALLGFINNGVVPGVPTSSCCCCQVCVQLSVSVIRNDPDLSVTTASGWVTDYGGDDDDDGGVGGDDDHHHHVVVMVVAM